MAVSRKEKTKEGEADQAEKGSETGNSTKEAGRENCQEGPGAKRWSRLFRICSKSAGTSGDMRSV